MSTLITGTPGSGKTTLVNYAKSQGDRRFCDADDMPGLCEWREFASGKTIGLVDEVTMISDDNWYKKHGWYWRTGRLQQWIKDNPEGIICGSSENIADCYRLFDRVILLRKTQAELLRNLQSPDRQNPFGKSTKQRAGFMEWQDYLIREAKVYPHSFIDSNDVSKTYQLVLQQFMPK